MDNYAKFSGSLLPLLRPKSPVCWIFLLQRAIALYGSIFPFLFANHRPVDPPHLTKHFQFRDGTRLMHTAVDCETVSCNAYVELIAVELVFATEVFLSSSSLQEGRKAGWKVTSMAKQAIEYYLRSFPLSDSSSMDHRLWQYFTYYSYIGFERNPMKLMIRRSNAEVFWSKHFAKNSQRPPCSRTQLP